jgi:hypothetical protein
MNPITISVNDLKGNCLFSASLDYAPGSDLQGYLETLVNTGASGAFSFGLQYYGNFQNPGLGYLVTMFQPSSAVGPIYDAPNAGLYWDIIYNKNPAAGGVDSLFPAPGATIVFQQATYTAATPTDSALAAKHVYHSTAAKTARPPVSPSVTTASTK